MGDGIDIARLMPRLCHIVRWPDFNGYGFNLHAEKGKAGQFIGKVDEGSPAEAAGLKAGDRIVEVNGTNIGNENHKQVVERIKAGGNETRLLVVDAETDQHYKDEKKVVRGDLPEVNFISSARDESHEPETTTVEEPAVTDVEPIVHALISDDTNASEPEPLPDESSQHRPRLCHLCKWPEFDGYGFNLHAEKDKPGQFIGSVDPDSPSETGGLRDGDRIIEVNGENIETSAHSAVIQKIKAGGDKTSMLVVDKAADDYYKSRGITVTSSMPNVDVISTPVRSGDMDSSNHGADSVAQVWERRASQEQTSDAIDVSNTEVDVSTLPEPNFSDEEGSEEVDAARDDMADAMASVTVHDAVDAEQRVDYNTYEEVDFSATQSYEDSGSASNGINGGTIVNSVPEPEPEPAIISKPAEPEPEPEPATVHSSNTVSASGDDDLLNLSAAEMKERLRSRRKQDPRLQKTSFEAKHKMFEKM